MNNGTQYNIGDYNTPQIKERTDFTHSVVEVCGMDANDKGCERNTKGQTAIRTSSIAANSILRCQFLPKLHAKKDEQFDRTKAKTERDFYKSLSIVAKKNNIEPITTQNKYKYPYNITLALWDLQEKLKCNIQNWDSIYFVKNKRNAFLATTETFNTCAILFYIPIVPLFQMLRDKNLKINAHLLLSVCSYLYHIVKVPYYRQDDSYLSYQYDLHRDWLEQDEEIEDLDSSWNQIRIAEGIGDIIEEKIKNINNLSVFENRLTTFKIRDHFDQECWNIANKAFYLYQDFPDTSIFRNAPNHDNISKKERPDYDFIEMEKYISFYADSDGWLFTEVIQCVNNEFNEYMAIDEPTIFKPLDRTRLVGNNFDFEERAFDIIEDLRDLLVNYKKELK